MKRTVLLLMAVFSAAGSTRAIAPPQIEAWVARDAAPGPKVRLTINTRNVPVVQIEAFQVQGLDWLLNRDRQHKRPLPGAAPVKSWSVSASTPGQRPSPNQADVYRSRQVNLPPLSPGVYLLVLNAGAASAWAVVNVTDLAVVVKRSPRAVAAWVTDVKTGSPVSGADAGLYWRDGQRLGGASTRADGLAQFPAPAATDQVVIIRYHGDLAAVPIGVSDPDGALTMHFQTDRPVYRPGQTVFFKAILRRTKGRGYTAVADTTCSVQVRDAKDNPLSEETISTNAVGTLDSRVDIPEAGSIGPYTIAIRTGKDTAYGQFTVAAYRKPEFKVTVRPEKERYLAGETLRFALQARYYFGAPLPQAGIRYQVRRSPTPYGAVDEGESWYSGGDGNLYPHDTYNAHPFVAEGTVTTDESGNAVITVPAQKDLPDSRYDINCTVTDASRRQVEASAGVQVYGAAKRIALSTDLLFTSLGSNIPVKILAVDLDGKPTSAHVTLIVSHAVWDEVAGRYQNREIARTTVNVPTSGMTVARVPARAEGSQTVRAVAPDGTGRVANAAMSVWVASPTTKPERMQAGPSVSVRLDRRAYLPGENVRVWITTNTPERPILVTAEGLEAWRVAMLPAGRSGRAWAVPARLAMSPNFQITASQWTRNGLISGSALVRVPDKSRHLSVTVKPERNDYRPGDLARYVLTTRGQDGMPVSADVAVTVVDEAIYAVRPDTTPDPFTLFWGLRPNAVTTAFSAPEEVSGGAYQRVNATAPVRERFVDTALWQPHAVTGPDGTAAFTVEIPGNLTSWRATATAVTGDTRVGRATSSVRVSRPVMLRLATPRQMAAGDRITLRGTVNNRTDSSHVFEAMLSSEGARVEGETMKRVTVPANGEGIVEWTLNADTLPDSGQATLTARAIAADAPADKGEDFSDALRVPIRIVPNGVAERIRQGATMTSESTSTLTLPSDRIEPASEVKVTVRTGLAGVVSDMAHRLLATRAFGTADAADQLLTASAPGVTADPKVFREAVALLARNQQGNGAWGWWEDDPADAEITAHALTALARASSAGLPVPRPMLRRGASGGVYMVGQTGLWEHRALLSAAVALAESALAREQAGPSPSEHSDGPRLLDDVRRRGEFLSPYARLVLDEGWLAVGNRAAAQDAMASALSSAAIGPDTAYVPAGERLGWDATEVETTAQALTDIQLLKPDSDLAPKMALRLATPDEGVCCRSTGDDAVAAYALSTWLAAHPSPARSGTTALVVNGQGVAGRTGLSGDVVTFDVPRRVLADTNTFTLKRTGEGEAFTSIEAVVYRTAADEADHGVRVLRRLEVQDANGVWNRVADSIPAASPVRVTVVVWPDDRAGALRVTEPLPAGFEFADGEYSGVREEVRDGAVIHELRGNGRPQTFRYYIRAESAGRVTAPPAVSEVLRRPGVNGHSSPQTLEVRP
ncbi:MAG TPA: MG2 domain-containing protein [Armatimonadota bacterium]|jgi:hypothetical protein